MGARLGLTRRDPMFLTMATLLEVESFPSVASLARYSSKLQPDLELRRIQWLFDGMTPEEVTNAWQEHNSPVERRRAGMFQNAEERYALWEARLKEDQEEGQARANL